MAGFYRDQPLGNNFPREAVFERISGCKDSGYTIGIYASTDRSTGEACRGVYAMIRQKATVVSRTLAFDTVSREISGCNVRCLYLFSVNVCPESYSFLAADFSNKSSG